MRTRHYIYAGAIAVLVAAGTTLLMPQTAYSHNTDNERRTVRACKSLGPVEEAVCKACVRKGPYHYHPKLNVCHKNIPAR